MNLGNRFSQHSFAQIPSVNMARSKFDRSFAIKDTFDFDYLIPILVDEILPGDTVNLNVQTFARLATQVVPLLDNMYLDYFFFFVPNRLVWSNWEKFMGAREPNPSSSIDYLVPKVDVTTAMSVGTIYDKFGLPTDVIPGATTRINALPFRGYNLIWNTWFRDENLQNSVTVLTGDGPDAPATYTLLKRGKKHDYFTSALPNPQKGTPVQLAVTGTIPVTVPTTGASFAGSWRRVSDGSIQNSQTGLVTTAGGLIQTNPSTTTVYYDPVGSMTATATGFGLVTTINQLRQAMMLQSLLELDARGGTRYVEILKSHFNVISPDFRLQRPEFLSSTSTRFVQHVVPQNSESGTTPQANLAAYSTTQSGGSNVGFSKSFVEHGFIFGLVQARGDITYQQGINRMWQRSTRYDYFWPKLQELGEQEVYQREIYMSPTVGADALIFGYQERYAEYRYHPSEIRGQFRSTFATSLDVWHLAEEFGSAPLLNNTFIQSNTPIERSLVMGANYPDILFDCWFNYKHIRPIMTYGVPATLGRF